MAELTKLCKAVVVVDTALEKQALEKFQELGVKGYTCMHCFGRGQHAVYEEPWVGHSQSRIEMITSHDIGEKIIDYLHSSDFAHHPVTGYLETVEVGDPKKFLK